MKGTDFLCLHRKFQSWNFLQVQTHLMRPWALQGPFREPQSQAVLWIEKSHVNFGQAEKTASMPDTIQMFSDQVSLCPAYNANRGRPSLQPSFPAPWQRGPWIVALKEMRSGDQRWWPQMGPGWEQHWWKKLGNFVAEKRVRTLKASQEESILVTMSVVQPKSWEFVLFGGKVRTWAQETVSQVTPIELTWRRQGRSQAIYKFATRGR